MNATTAHPAVSIAAIAARTPGGDSVDALVSFVERGDTAVAPFEGMDIPPGAPSRGARFRPPIHVDVDDPEKRILGHHGTLLMEIAEVLAPRVAELQVAPERVGLFAALGMIDADPRDLEGAAKTIARRGSNHASGFDEFFERGYRTIHPLWPLSMLNNVAVGQISIALDIRGDNAVFASRWDSGVRAIHEAVRAIAMNRADVAYVLGAAPPIDERSLARASLSSATARIPGEGAAGCLLVRGELLNDSSMPRLVGSATAFAGGGASEHTRREAGVALRRRATTERGGRGRGILMTASPAARAEYLGAWSDMAIDRSLCHACGCLGPADPLLALAVATTKLRASSSWEAAAHEGLSEPAVDHVWIVGDDESGGMGAVWIEAP